ncbi:Methyltransferase OMS1, mitochondrial [Golovinomyces cichoracearum]|uniref:Methyltransferase OMS1, mitochondrial n=1 Tax=Golovinomyces cichoracearum TaxID=62708 RepID=A0A420I996_9PEZI|nr:Methyltransferase OMS1, mitochondrial [Golovinomyces cichoracearum]
MGGVCHHAHFKFTLSLNHLSSFWWRKECYKRMNLAMTRSIQTSRLFPREASSKIRNSPKFNRESKIQNKSESLPSTTNQALLSTPNRNRINRLRYHPVSLFIGGTAVAFFAGYITYTATGFYRLRSKPAPTEPLAQVDYSSRYESIANSFDDTVDSTEYWLGLTSLRKELISRAHGEVLEVSIGTGRNLAYYDWYIQGRNSVSQPGARNYVRRGKVKSFTAVDMSPQMLGIAKKKLEALIPGIQGVRWIIGDAAVRGTIPKLPSLSENDEGKYDTIIETMGLCSAKDPVALLRNLGEYIKEEEGRILLLEHGRGRWKWLNAMLDKSAEDHAHTFGCWWNRDIQKIVEESGLEMVQIKNPKWWHGGTTWWVELKKAKPTSQAQISADKS